MKEICSFLFVFVLSFSANAQILREQTSAQTIASQIPGFSQVSAINTINVSYTPPIPSNPITPIDGDTTTEGNGLYDYGTVLPVSISMNNGNITTTTLGNVWTIQINIPNALNIGLTFTQFDLSPTAEMYIYNGSKNVLDKGIKKEHFTLTDTVFINSIKGNSIVVYIIEPGNFGTFQTNITIGEVIGGYREVEDVGESNDGVQFRSATINCNPHVLCYPENLMSARAVARITTRLTPTSVGFGTGTLINNEQNNGRAFLLTAFHVIDRNGDGVFDANEISLLRNSTSFQFHFWRSECNGAINNNGIQYNGAIIRSSNRASDMVLLELINQPGIGDGVNYAGWSRQTATPSNTNSFILHHPRGNDMRHTKTRIVRHYLLNPNYWQAFYASGVVDPGSSGSALFNENRQIIGQLKGGWSSCNYTDFSDRYGKFNSSWNNGNLGMWLSPIQGLQNTGTLVLSSVSIQGDANIACSETKQYSVPNLLEATYNWQVSSNLQIVSGQGTANITVSASGTNANGNISVTIGTPTKGRIRTLTVTKNITIGGPQIESITVSNPSAGVYGSACYGNRGNEVNITTRNPVGHQDFVVTITNPSGVITTLNTGATFTLPTYITNSLGWYTIQARPNSSCGLGTNFGVFFDVINCGRGFNYSISPNPVSSDITVAATTVTNGTVDESLITEVSIYDQQGNLKKRQKFAKVKKATLNISSLPFGVYFIEVGNGKTKEKQQIVIQR